MDYRVIRVPLPVALLHEIDEIVMSGRGGFEARADVVREAVEALVAELKYGLADPEPDRLSASVEDSMSQSPSVTSSAHRLGSAGAELSVLGPRPNSEVVANGVAEVVDDYLFGLHNRDYPTLWAASRLAEMTQAALIPVDEFYRQIADQAWSFAERLQTAESKLGQKLTALFPTNRAKPESSESAFLSFAVGTHSGVDVIRANGPLYVWRLAQLTRNNGTLMVGLTAQALSILDALSELTVEAPHPPELAQAFFEYLHGAAFKDWTGFGEILHFVAEGLRRPELVARLSSAHPEWTETVAATNAAGYVARSREWGLIAPRQVEGRYELTDIGRQLISTQWGGQE
jgi:hypothetical protein